MWLARYVDGTATMEGLIGPSRDKEGVRVLARSGVWLAGWRDPITGLLVALCGRGAVENKPLLLFQSDGERVARLPQDENHRDTSLVSRVCGGFKMLGFRRTHNHGIPLIGMAVRRLLDILTISAWPKSSA